MTTAFAPGSLVSARGRDWVVLPETEPDMLVLRPLGGSDDDVAALFPALEDVQGAHFAPPTADDLGSARAAGLLAADSDVGGEWLPTPEFDLWREAPAERRWLRLAEA
ncbi:hypothetical protein ACFQZU_14460, partial [Streptomonospora algeriensis]